MAWQYLREDNAASHKDTIAYLHVEEGIKFGTLAVVTQETQTHLTVATGRDSCFSTSITQTISLDGLFDMFLISIVEAIMFIYLAVYNQSLS